MDVAALKAALPAATVSAFTGITLNAQVRVDDQERSSEPAATQAWWQHVGQAPEGNALARRLVAEQFVLELTKGGVTEAELDTWVGEAHAAFGGFCNPTGITRLRAATVDGVERTKGSPDRSLRIFVTFHGESE